MPRHLPLSGRLVVEHSHAGASPVTRRAIAIAGRIAADLGATVVRDLSAGGGDGDAACGMVAGRFLDAGKLTFGGARKPGDASVLDALPRAADAVLTDASELPPDLARAAVRVVVASGVPTDLGVPEHEVTDTMVLALSGLLDIVGHAGEAPVPLGGAQAAGLAGLAAFSGLVAALAAGGRETVHVSAVETCLWSNWKSYAERLYMGRTPTRQGKLAEWQALPCADGFATLIFLEKDWPAVCRMIGDPRLAVPPLDTQAGRRADMSRVYEIVRPWYALRTRAEIRRLAAAEGLPIAPVLTVGEVIDDRQYAAQRFFAPPAGDDAARAARVPTIPTVWSGERFPPRAAPAGIASAVSATAPAGANKPTPQGPLAASRVLDLGIITAGASTSALLADLGADVVKVEASAYIDPFRTWDRGIGAPDWWNRSRFFEFTNRNKRGIALDLKHPKGKALFLDLVAEADVVVENFRRGVLERLGLGWDVLSHRNPRLVLCSITSQGEGGPEAGAASYGSTLEASSGLADLTRDKAGNPLISGILLNYPDQIVSIYAAGIVTLAVMEQRRTGRGARLDVSQRELATFLIGDHVLAATSGTTPPSMPAADIARAEAGAWQVRARGGAAVPVRNGDDILAAVARGEIRAAFARTPGGRDAKGMPFTLAGAPLTIARPAPLLGEHNAEVLRELGLPESTIAALANEGVIGSAPKG